MIQPGTFDAKLVDYGMNVAKSGTLMILMKFELQDEQNSKIVWQGHLKQGSAHDITLKSLLVCGLKTNDLEAVAEGPISGVLDMDKTVSIVVEMEAGEDGKSYPRVKWINEVGGAGFKSQITKSDAIQKMNGMNLKGELMKLRQDTGYSTNAVNEEIPF